jgi:8-oxo-dGTP pyrophosphatase MutT (NUDIX family)
MLDVWSAVENVGPIYEHDDARSAVLVVLFRDEEGHVRIILTRRPDDMLTHPGDIVCPGGRMEAGESVVEAALREAHEEVGLDPSIVEIVGGSEPFWTRSIDEMIVPVIGRIRGQLPELIRSEREVAEILTPRLDFLMTTTDWHSQEWRGYQIWFLELPEGILWGATAGMLRRLFTLMHENGSDQGGV